jgi:hypothetical protein
MKAKIQTLLQRNNLSRQSSRIQRHRSDIFNILLRLLVHGIDDNQ